ncbi:MAG: hypothetical protein SVK54_05105 [candidate division WOR-3 bacterium]|nr:hypothetical protein [candidate division WOR-3 bacterium]
MKRESRTSRPAFVLVASFVIAGAREITGRVYLLLILVMILVLLQKSWEIEKQNK